MVPTAPSRRTKPIQHVHYSGSGWWHWEALGRSPDRMSGFERTRADARAQAERWARVIRGRQAYR